MQSSTERRNPGHRVPGTCCWPSGCCRAVLALGTISIEAEIPRVPEPPVAIEIAAPADHGVRAARCVAPAVRRSRVSRRPRAHLAVSRSSAACRRCAWRRMGELHRVDRQRPLVARTHSLRRHGADRHCRRADGADARRRRPAARRARLVRHRVARRRRRRRSMSASSGSTGSCASISARTGSRPAASRSRCRPACARCPTTRASRRWSSCRTGLPLAGTLIAISERGLDSAGNLRAF